jgi:uncharacterized membrane-anchored protein
MKNFISILLLLCATTATFAQKNSKKTPEPTVVEDDAPSKAELKAIDSLNKSFKYEHGTVALGVGGVSLNIPEGFKFLDKKQAETVLYEVYGNPRSDDGTNGLIFPENQDVVNDGGYFFNVSYEAMGYVKDDDADKIDYAELLSNMKTEATEASVERKKEGYPSIEIVGWANPPFYDKERKILHWAKEIKFGDNPDNTLNYDVRVLSREGVVSLNAVAGIEDLATVKENIPKILNIVALKEGSRYADFNPSMDKIAAVTIGGLVAGKLLAKAGFFVIILKFIKPILLGLVAGGSALWRWITGRKKEDDEQKFS